jgi:integrase
MVGSGEHPRVIQHRLGHSTARLSLELYAHVSEDADRTAAAHLEDLFNSPGRGIGTDATQAPRG